MPKTTLIDCCIKKYAYREVSQIYQELEISGEGLSQSQVELMREKYGVNSFSQRRNDTMLRLLRRAFINPFNIILSSWNHFTGYRCGSCIEFCQKCNDCGYHFFNDFD